jgi:hypothetical protein
MSLRNRKVAAYASFLLAGIAGTFSAYLLLSPLHPAAGDSHGGLLAAWSGLLVVPIGLVLLATGGQLLRRTRGTALLLVLSLALLIAEAIALFQ